MKSLQDTVNRADATSEEKVESQSKRKNKRKSRPGGKRSRAAGKAAQQRMIEKTEAFAAAQGEAAVAATAASAALEKSKCALSANQSLLGTTARELQSVTAKLTRVNKAAGNLAPWVRRPSTQPARFVDEPRILIVLRGVFDDDLCDATALDLLSKKAWVLQGGDSKRAGGLSSSRYQLNVPKPKPSDQIGLILKKFSENLHFTPRCHSHLRSPCAIKGGSVQRWHLDNGHGRSLSLIAALRRRAFEFAAVGMDPTPLSLEKGDCLLFTSWVWHRGLENPADSVAFFAYFDDEHFDLPPPSEPNWSAAQDENRAGFKLMLDDDQWDELNAMHQDDPQLVQFFEINVRADEHAIERLPCMLGKAFKYKEDYTSMEL